MNIRLSFLGAARNVTGSRYLLQADWANLLVDCGLFQEREFLHRNWELFSFPPGQLDAVLITHAHLDHCGLLPRLVNQGYRGPIICTRPTAEIAKIILLDAARLQEEDAAYKKKRHQREGRQGPYPEIPLYTTAEAEAVLPLFSTVDYGQPVTIARDVEATFYDAGHVLGSSMIRLNLGRGNTRRSIIFSGDIGRWDRPIMPDPSLFRQVDYIVMESTYGDQVHTGTHEISEQLAEVINWTFQAGGNIIVPSFALQRAQEILYYIFILRRENRIPDIPIYLDSPMAAKINEVYRRYTWLLDREMRAMMQKKATPFDFPGLRVVETTEESKALNYIQGTAMIIAGSGMCTGGRIKHHLANNISRPECSILFIGYQAAGTLGRQILDGAESVRIHGQQHQVRARIVQVHGLSAHADRDDLLRWLSGLAIRPRHVFITHGETKAAEEFKNFLTGQTGLPASVPAYGDTAILNHIQLPATPS